MFEVYPTRIVLDILLLCAVWLPTIILATVGQPFRRGFYCDDESIRYPYKESTVPNWILYVVGAFLPIATITVIEVYRVLKFDPQYIYKREQLSPVHKVNGKPISPLVSNLYMYIGYFCFGAALCQCITDLGKYAIGRHRPHFLSICNSSVNCVDHVKDNPWTYVEDPKCQPNDTHHEEIIREAQLSFPSGHSSFGAYTMFFLVLYIQARLIWPMVSLLVKHVLQNVCVVLGVACALSRISDYKHHWSDVLSGVILGIIVACLTVFHMVGLFRHPHRVFTDPPYSFPPNTQSSFAGDHFHNPAEYELFREQLVRMGSVKMNNEDHPMIGKQLGV